MVRVGIIGRGFGLRVVAPCFRAAGCEVVDVVSARDEAAVAELCRSKLDLVSVHSPPFLHVPHVTMALEAGRAVLCDKPFGLSAAEAADMARAAESSGVVNAVNFEFRFEPARQKVRDLIAEGHIGVPEHLHMSAFLAGSRHPLRPYGWLFDAGRGGGWIGAFGSHVIDSVRWLLGEIDGVDGRRVVRVVSRPDPNGGFRTCDAEDGFVAWLELRSGASATIDTSFVAPVTLPPTFTVLGSEGAIENQSDRKVVLRGLDGTPTEFDFAPALGDPHLVAMTNWAVAVRDAVRDGSPLAPSFADGVACAEIMDRLRATPLLVAGSPVSQ